MSRATNYLWLDAMCIPSDGSRFAFVCESSTVSASSPTTSPTSQAVISGSFELVSSSDLSSIFDDGCSIYCSTIKLAIAYRFILLYTYYNLSNIIIIITYSMSISEYAVSSDSVELRRVNGRRLTDHHTDHRNLQQSISIGYSVKIKSSLQV